MSIARVTDTRKTYRALVATLGVDKTTTFNNAIARSTSISEAVFISWFLWMWDKKSRGIEMFLIEADFCDLTCIPQNAFRTIVKKWEDLGIIKTRIKGIPPKKRYKLNEVSLTEYLTKVLQDTPNETSPRFHRIKSVETKEMSPEKPKGYIKPETLKSPLREKDNTAARTKRPGQRSVKPLVVLHQEKPEDTPEHRLSVQLFKILRPIVEPNADGMPKRGWEVDEKTGKNKRTGPRDWRDWHKAFRSKLSEGRHDEQEISRILKWYGDNIQERYTPQLYSANTFCKELHRLIKQMKTGNEDTMQSRRKRAQQNGSCEWTENGIRYQMYADGSYIGRKGSSIVDTGFIGSKGDKPDNFESEVS